MNLADETPREKAMQSQIMLVHRANQRLSEENADLKLQVAELLDELKFVVEWLDTELVLQIDDCVPSKLEIMERLAKPIAKAEDDQ